MAKRTALVAPPAAPGIRRLGVVVVDPLPVVRAGLSLLIEDRPDMEVLAEAGGADEGLEAIQRLRRSRVVVLVGLGLGGEHDAYWLIRAVRERFPTHAILGCGANADPTDISRALFVGADGFVDKSGEQPTTRWCSPARRPAPSAGSPTASNDAATWSAG
jgi:DNA-binding NarL/FixJ family response regulator